MEKRVEVTFLQDSGNWYLHYPRTSLVINRSVEIREEMVPLSQLERGLVLHPKIRIFCNKASASSIEVIDSIQLYAVRGDLELSSKGGRMKIKSNPVLRSIINERAFWTRWLVLEVLGRFPKDVHKADLQSVVSEC